MASNECIKLNRNDFWLFLNKRNPFSAPRSSLFFPPTSTRIIFSSPELPGQRAKLCSPRPRVKNTAEPLQGTGVVSRWYGTFAGNTAQQMPTTSSAMHRAYEIMRRRVCKLFQLHTCRGVGNNKLGSFAQRQNDGQTKQNSLNIISRGVVGRNRKPTRDILRPVLVPKSGPAA